MLDQNTNPGQGHCTIEDDVEDFCGLCDQVDFNDVALKHIFRFGLNKNISRFMPLHTPNWTLAKYTDYALLLCGSFFTVGIVEEEPRNTAFPIPEYFHAPTVMSVFIHATTTTPEPAHIMPVTSWPPLQSLFTLLLPLQTLNPSCCHARVFSHHGQHSEATRVILRRMRLASSLEDMPLVSMRAAGTSALVPSLRVSEVVPRQSHSVLWRWPYTLLFCP